MGFSPWGFFWAVRLQPVFLRSAPSWPPWLRQAKQPRASPCATALRCAATTTPRSKAASASFSAPARAATSSSHRKMSPPSSWFPIRQLRRCPSLPPPRTKISIQAQNSPRPTSPRCSPRPAMSTTWMSTCWPVPPQWQRYPADPPWGTACVVIPWYLYLYYDDVRVLAENYSLMKGWVDYLSGISEGHIVRFSKYGDWCPPGKVRSLDTPGELISTWCYYHDLLHLAKIAGILRKSADAEKYAKLSEATKKAFNREFLEEDYYSHNSKTADALLHFELCPDYDMKGYRKRVLYSQTANVLPLYLEMTPENKKAAVSQNLFENVEVTYGSHLNTGILGTRYLLDTLTQYGRSDLAYSVATQTSYPSWARRSKARSLRPMAPEPALSRSALSCRRPGRPPPGHAGPAPACRTWRDARRAHACRPGRTVAAPRACAPTAAGAAAPRRPPCPA